MGSQLHLGKRKTLLRLVHYWSIKEGEVMATIGYHFYVEGEFCKRLRGLPDPSDEDWEVFVTPDLHPFGKDAFTVWVSNFREHCDEAREKAAERAIEVVEWIRGERNWEGFDANLYLANRKIFSWELC